MKRLILSFLLTLGLISAGCAVQSEPNVSQIKADLIGSSINVGTASWQFAALSEYEQVEIKDKKTESNTTEYDVSMRLVDLASNTHYLADVLIVYRQTGGKWSIVSVVPKRFEQAPKGTDA